MDPNQRANRIGRAVITIGVMCTATTALVAGLYGLGWAAIAAGLFVNVPDNHLAVVATGVLVVAWVVSVAATLFAGGFAAGGAWDMAYRITHHWLWGDA